MRGPGANNLSFRLLSREEVFFYENALLRFPLEYYYKYIFTEAPKMAANGEDWVEAMLPQNAPDSCKAGKKERAQA